MTFEDLLDQVLVMLQRRGRVSYRTLTRQFALDEAYLEDLKEAILFAHPQAIDEAGRGLVWSGDAGAVPPPEPDFPQPVDQPVMPTPQGSLSAVSSPAPYTPDAERRQLTVLFCDLVDSTVLASQLDPEDLREVVRAYQETCAKVIARFDGHIAQYLGDGLLVYFGYPLAHEDDAQRAVLAGLGIVEALGQLNTRLARERRVHLAVRLGIHTGLVVVGDVGDGTRQEQLALGETPNLTARLQGLAAPNTLVISAATLQLLGGFFACQSLGTPLLKGFAQPLEVYVEELTKMVLESGLLQEQKDRYELTEPLPPLAIPATLHDSLMARLDRLATVKGLAQLGATLGREFSYALLQAVAPWDEATLQRGLHQLVEAEFLYQRGVPPQATYLFKHALIQDTAYQSLLRSTRQQYHQRIAQVLEARFPETGETQPELLAHHYTEAGLGVQAIPYWQRAGQRAIERSANPEAVSHLTQGLTLLTMAPETPERAHHELAMLTTIGPALIVIATKGYAAADVEHTYRRAQQLCEVVGDPSQRFQVLHGMWLVYYVRAALQTAYDLSMQLLSLAQQQHDTALLLAAHRAMGYTLLHRGKFTEGRAHVEQVLVLYDLQHHRGHAFRFGATDPGVGCWIYAAWSAWVCGSPDRALTFSHEAVTLAQEIDQPLSLAVALFFATLLLQCRREGPATHEQTEAVITHARAQRYPLYVAWGTAFQGWALSTQGHADEAIARVRQGLADARATGAELLCPYFLALLAEVYGHSGQPEAGLTVVTEGLALVEKNHEAWWAAELHRLQGLLLLQHSVPDLPQAETCFRQAIAVARQQQAKSLELRASMSLSRLWQRQGKRAEAHDLLAPIYSWFTEGFDTADLQEARALLVELQR